MDFYTQVIYKHETGNLAQFKKEAKEEKRIINELVKSTTDSFKNLGDKQALSLTDALSELQSVRDRVEGSKDILGASDYDLLIKKLEYMEKLYKSIDEKRKEDARKADDKAEQKELDKSKREANAETSKQLKSVSKIVSEYNTMKISLDEALDKLASMSDIANSLKDIIGDTNYDELTESINDAFEGMFSAEEFRELKRYVDNVYRINQELADAQKAEDKAKIEELKRRYQIEVQLIHERLEAEKAANKEIADAVNRKMAHEQQFRKEEADAEREAAKLAKETLDEQLSALNGVVNEYNNLDITLKEALTKLSAMRDKADELKDVLGDTNYNKLTESIDESAKKLVDEEKKRVESAIRSTSEYLKNVVGSSLRGTFGVAKKSGTVYISLLKSSFSKLFQFIRNGFNLSMNRNGLGKATNELSQQIKQLLSIGGVVGLVKVGKDMANLSSDMVEVRNVTKTVFKDMTESINDWAKNSSQRFGLTELESQKMLGVFGGIAQSMSITNEQSVIMSKNLTALAGDIASFYNLNVDDIYTKLQSGFTGSSVQAMRQLGVNMTVANLEAYRLSKGIEVSYKNMNNATKATLRYNYMIESLINSQGDFQRTQYSFANQLRQLTINLKQLGSILGGIVIKVIYPFITALNSMTKAAIQASYSLAKVFGFDASSLEKMFGQSGAISEDAANAYDDQADAIENVGKKAKKAGDNLQVFDKLNNITTDSSSSSSKGLDNMGESIIDALSYEEKIGELGDKTKIEKWLEGLWELLSDRKWKDAGKYIADGTNSLVASLRKTLNDPKLYKGTHDFNEAITDFWDGLLDIDTVEVGKLFGDGLNYISFVINDFYETATSKDLFRRTGSKLENLIYGMVTETDWREVGKAATTGMRIVLDTLAGFMLSADNDNLGSKLGKAFNDFLSGAVDRVFGDGGAEQLGLTLARGINQALEFMISAFGDDDNAVYDIADGVVTVIDTAISNIDSDDLHKAASALGKLFAKLFSSLAKIISDNKDKISNDIAGAVNGIADDGTLSDMAESFASLFIQLVDLVVLTIEHIHWDKVGSEVWDGIKNAIDSDPDAADNVAEALKKVFLVLVGFNAVKFGLPILGAKLGNKLIGFIADSFVSGVAKLGSVIKSGFDVIDIAGSTGEITSLATIGTDVAEASTEVAEAGSTLGTTLSSISSLIPTVVGSLTVAATAFGTVAGGIEHFTMAAVEADGKAKFNRVISSLSNLQQYWETDTLEDYIDDVRYLTVNFEALGEKGFAVDEVREFSNMLGDIAGTESDIYKKLEDAIKKYDAATPIEKFGGKAKAELVNVVNEIEAEIYSSGESLKDACGKKAVEAGDYTGYQFKDGTLSKIPEIKTELSGGLSSALLNSANSVKDDAYSAGSSIGTNLVNGILEGIKPENSHNALTNAMNSLGQQTANAYAQSLGIHSPSRVFADISKWIPEGVRVGIEETTDSAVDATSDLSDRLISSFDSRQIDISKILDVTKFGDVLDTILSKSDSFRKDLVSNLDLRDVNQNLKLSSNASRIEQTAFSSSISSNRNLETALAALISRANPRGNNNITCTLQMDGINMAEFVIDTMRRTAVQTGGF